MRLGRWRETAYSNRRISRHPQTPRGSVLILEAGRRTVEYDPVKFRPLGPRPTPSSAFTLVELLTSIAIVCLLAGLGVAGFHKAVESSQTGRCASNLRTLAQAVLNYSADEGGKVPPAMVMASPAETGGAGHRLWIDYLSPYIPPLDSKAQQHPYLCPSAKRPGAWNNTCPDYGCSVRWSEEEDAGAFALQSWNPEPHPGELRVTRIQNPSQLIMFADTYASNSIYQTGRWAMDLRVITNGTTASSLLAGGIAPRHQTRGKNGLGRFNAAFFDGHVESIDVEDPRVKDPEIRRRWVTVQ